MSGEERIGSLKFIDELARCVDPAAFKIRKKSERVKRIDIAYARIRAALYDYGNREHDEYARPYTGGFRDEDIPW